MFCAKCGAQISESDQFCPKCGKENINYVKPVTPHIEKPAEGKPFTKAFTKLAAKPSTEPSPNPSPNKGRLLAVGIIGAIVIAGILGLVLVRGKGANLFSSSANKAAWTPSGITGYIDKEGNLYFVEEGEVTSFEGKMTYGHSSPDHSKYLALTEEGDLLVYEAQEDEYVPTTIGEDVDSVVRVNDKGCFYVSKTKEHLYYYDFKDKAVVDTGMEEFSYQTSLNGNTVIGGKDSGEISIFTIGDTSSRALCNVDEDTCFACVADDGSNMIWAVQDGNTYGIYMLKNGAPERIGKITNTEKYSTVSGFFYNDDKSFMIFSTDSSQMIVNQNGEIKELVLPGVKGSSALMDSNGNFMDSDDDFIEEPYLTVKKTKASDIGGLYKLTKDGSFALEVDGIDISNAYFIRNGTVYFINEDGDLCSKKLGEGNEVVSITTDVKKLFVPKQGGYAYVVKAGSLYYIDLSDKEYKLNLIWNKIDETDTIRFTDKPDVIYFVTDFQKIEDSYRKKGTLYRFVVGSEPKELAKNILYIMIGDAQFVNAEHPIFEQYVSHKKYDYIINVGTCSEGEYKELIQSVKE